MKWLSRGLPRVTARFGFMENIDIEPIVASCATKGLSLYGTDTTFYSADAQIVPLDEGFARSCYRNLYVVMKRNSRAVTTSLGIPADAHAKLCIEVPM